MFLSKPNLFSGQLGFVSIDAAGQGQGFYQEGFIL